MFRASSLASLAVLLAACNSETMLPSGKLFTEPPAVERVQTSTFPMAQDVWRVVVKGDGRVDKDMVEKVALYQAADLTIKRGYDRFIVQSTALSNQQRPITQTLTQAGETAGVATNLAAPGLGGLITTGSGAVVGGLDRMFTSFGGEIVIKMYKKDENAGTNALDAVDTLNAYVNDVKRPG